MIIDINEDIFRELVSKYYTRKQLAKHFNCSTSTIGTRLRKFGLSINSYTFNEDLTQCILKDILNYNEDTGIFTWKVRLGSSNVCIGTIAGTNTKGYICIQINSKIYKAHRLAWLYKTGDWPTNEIDHIDRNKSNNIWSNLRDTTHSVNMLNVDLLSSNTSGTKGVYWNISKNKWQVTFRSNYVGAYVNKADAIDARKKAEEIYY